MTFTDPTILRKAWSLRDSGMTYERISEVIQKPVGSIGGWIRDRARIERELARREKAAREEKTQQRRRQAGKRQSASQRVPPETINQMRVLYEQKIELAPGFVTRVHSISSLAEAFKVSKPTTADILHRRGNYSEAS